MLEATVGVLQAPMMICLIRIGITVVMETQKAVTIHSHTMGKHTISVLVKIPAMPGVQPQHILLEITIIGNTVMMMI